MFDNIDFDFNIEDSPEGIEDFLKDNEDEDDSSEKEITTAENEDSEDVGGDEDDQDEGGKDDSSSSNLYSSLAAVIHEQGLLPSLDIEKEKIESIDDFVNAFKKEQEVQAQLKLDEYVKNIDVQSIAESKQIISNLESIDEDYLKNNVETAKQIIFDDYLNQGISESKAIKMLNRLIDLGEDAILEDAQESLESLKEFESRKIELEKENYTKRIAEEKAYQEKLDNDIKNTIYNKKDLINGLPVTKALQDKVYKSINDIVGKAPDGTFENRFMKERRENPIEFETRMYYLYELTNGFKDYSKLMATGKSKAVNELEKIAKKTSIKDNGLPLWAQDSNSYDAMNFELNI
jgi:hypothetical protein